MSLDLLYKKYAVKVNQGSGCLIQPCTEKEYTYVITAKHNLEIDNPPSIKTIKEKELKVIKVFLHSQFDLAIIQVDFEENIGLLILGEIPDYARLILYGFPENKGQDDYVAKKVVCELIEKNNPFFVIKSADFSEQDQVSGFSGCGVFQEINGEVYLSGVEYRMDSYNDTQARLNFLPIENIYEIIEDNDIAKLEPKYLNDFNELIDESFESLKDDISKISRSILTSIGKNVLSNKLVPKDIIENYKTILSVKGVLFSEYHVKMWIGWLEFLTLCIIERNEFDSIDDKKIFLEKLVKNKRFFFINDSEWVNKLKKIFNSDLKGLDNNGIIIVNSYPFITNGRRRIPKNQIPVLINDVPPSKMNIDKGSNPFEFKIMHLSHLVYEILNNDDLMGLTRDKEEDIIVGIRKILNHIYGN